MVYLAAAALSAANVQTASYTLVAADAGKAVEMDVASANTLTVPPNSSVAFPAAPSSRSSRSVPARPLSWQGPG